MDTLDRNHLKQAAIAVLQDYVEFLGNDPECTCQIVIDESRSSYLLIEMGWHDRQRIYGTLIHLDIIDQKIWIQQDGTEEGVANELVKLGVPTRQIVLGYKSLERRKITDFAIC